MKIGIIEGVNRLYSLFVKFVNRIIYYRRRIFLCPEISANKKLDKKVKNINNSKCIDKKILDKFNKLFYDRVIIFKSIGGE